MHLRTTLYCVFVLLLVTLIGPGPLAIHAQGTGSAKKAEPIPGTANTREVEQLRNEVSAQRQMIEELKATVQQLAKQQQASSEQANALTGEVKAVIVQANEATAKAANAEIKTKGPQFIEHKKNTNATFITRGGEVTAYGNLDVSVDGATKDTGSLALNGNTPPVGNFGWLPEVATNSSYLGLRGFQRVGERPFNFVYQLEVGFEISATPGLAETNSSLKDTTNGALFNRNSYIGIANNKWGALKFGKTYAPYYNSTSRFNPFSGMLGDYSVVMGNSGGDNRVEFGTRHDHAIWYESPVFGGGFQFNALFAPGQNRSNTDDNIPDGESDCAGTNIPGSGGTVPIGCNDGSFGNAASVNLSYTKKRFYATVAYEWHQKVNRQSDITSIYGVAYPLADSGGVLNVIPVPAGPPITMPTALGQTRYNQDVADEDAAKIGLMYEFPTNTTVGVIAEHMDRYVPTDLQFQNERQRWGSWVVVSQKINNASKLHLGWAHAFHTPGDPGQHNDTITSPTNDGGLAGYASPDNRANMLTAAFVYLLSKNLSWYVDGASTLNAPSAHYDLGAGGHGIKTDCHDAFSTSGGVYSTPHCYTGTTLVGVSSGLRYTF